MPIVAITHSCGHPASVAGERAGWLATKPCRACWLERRHHAAQADARRALRHGMPRLSGTPAQVEWAEAVRGRLTRGLDRAIRSGQGERRTREFQTLHAWLLTHTEARWWIDHARLVPSQVRRLRNQQAIEAYQAAFGAGAGPEKAGPGKAPCSAAAPGPRARSSQR